MKSFVVLDLETTGLDENTCQILEVGGVIVHGRTLELGQTFHCYVLHEQVRGEPYALAWHAEILRRIANQPEGYNYYHPANVIPRLQVWADTHLGLGNRIAFCGKNFAKLDLQFLRKLPNFDKLNWQHRIMDLGNLFFQRGDEWLPDTAECYRRAGLDDSVKHTALEDAIDCAKAIQFALRARLRGADEMEALTSGP